MHTTVSAPRTSSIAQAQQFALPVVFALFGLVIGSWAGRIPAIAERVHVSHSSLSMILLCGGLGALLSLPLSTFMMRKFGARKSMLFGGLALLGVLVMIGMAPSVPRLMLAVFGLGVAASVYDVAINSAASFREKITGKSEMSMLHGVSCGGGLVGATLGGLMATMKIAPATHFLMLAGPLALVLWAAYTMLDGTDSTEVEEKKFSLPRGPLALLGALGFLGAMTEGSIADWSGVFMREHFRVSLGMAPMALSAFSLMMLIARLMGDRIKTRFGAARLVTTGSMIGAAGLFFAVLSPNAYFALVGFAVAGMGLALLFPFVFSAAGTQGPMALAGVASMAYSGSLMGPPVVGAVAHFVGMQAAIGYLGGLALVIAFVASRSKLLK